jgi:hypothetical protein
MFRLVLMAASVGLLSGIAFAESSHHSKYAGEQTREIKSLSADDVAELRRGGGWGLAKAAELNGLPGPIHILELKEQIGLTADQTAAIRALYDDMKNKAVPAGARLIALEKELDRSFRDGSITDASLRTMLDRIAKARRNLRYIHLSTHLKTPEILSKTQIARYNTLRGYAEDPCAKVPEGHDPAMWRRHNNCR